MRMPGEKRKLEEQNTWLTRQSKKLKKSDGSGQQQPNVYYSTLSKLRDGAKTFFSLASSSTVNEAAAAASSLPVFRPCDTCQRSSEGRTTFYPQHPLPCTYCEKFICHLNQCSRCNAGFCTSCSIQNYDGEDRLSDRFICISCLAEA